MRDFTREELYDLLIILDESIINFTQPPSIHLLRDLVQSKITVKHAQEACDHDWEFEFNDHHCLKCELRK